MINKFYYMRHGQTKANAERFMCGGATDLPLTELGQQQAEQAADFILNRLNPKLEITKFCVSPLVRAQQTAAALNSHLRLPQEIVPELREWVVGQWEGRPWSELHDDYFSDQNPPGGETRQELKDRAAQALHKILVADNVFIVAHGVVWDTIAGILNIQPKQGEPNNLRRIPNCCVLQITRHPGGGKTDQPDVFDTIGANSHWQAEILHPGAMPT